MVLELPRWGTLDERIRGGKEFDGNHWNDLHYTNAVKRAARASSRIRGKSGAGDETAMYGNTVHGELNAVE